VPNELLNMEKQQKYVQKKISEERKTRTGSSDGK
jgi:hypothetical protein